MSTALVSNLSAIALAIALGLAVAAKARDRAVFVEYLALALGDAGRWAAILVLGVEVVLAFGLLVPATKAVAALGVGAFLLVGTGFIARQLVLTDAVDCGCWGRRASLSRSARNGQDIVRPVWYGLRNGLLVFVAWLVLSGGRESEGYGSQWVALIAVASRPTLVGIGLASSIVTRRQLLGLPEHPLKTELAPKLAPLIALSWYLGHGYRLSPTGRGISPRPGEPESR